MADWIEEPGREEWVEFRHMFDYVAHPGCGYVFDVTEDGKLIEPVPEAEANYRECLTGVVSGQQVVDRGIIRSERSYFNPGRIRCASCGEPHCLQRGDSQCDCGQLYNACGQMLRPREEWEEPWDED